MTDEHDVEEFADEVNEAIGRALEAGSCGGCMVNVLLREVALLITTAFHDDLAEVEKQVQDGGAELRSMTREILDDIRGPLH